MIHSKPVIYTIDFLSGTSFLMGIFTGHNLIMILGGIASILAAINHGQQILQRRKQKKDVGKTK